MRALLTGFATGTLLGASIGFYGLLLLICAAIIYNFMGSETDKMVVGEKICTILTKIEDKLIEDKIDDFIGGKRVYIPHE